ncbi:MAG TPA: DUF4148 domain-containing protein [Paucimonas sp.]|nr:DUF4148 domain-containing protein [Paucimonas sp.]
MNMTKTAAILLLATAAAAASAADLVSIPLTAESGPAAQSGLTRAQVQQELREAIARGEIRHGDLADFHALLEASAPRAQAADNGGKPTDRTAGANPNEAQARVSQAGSANGSSSGR